MKTFTAALVFVIMVFIGGRMAGQNLVGNPSFEEHNGCPMWGDQMYYCTQWWNAGGDTNTSTPDYFNECSTNPPVTPPHLFSGYQIPHSGGAFCMLVTYYTAFSWYREYIQTQLTQSLVVGEKYYVSFFINLPGEANISYASNKTGALFTTYPFEEPNYATINNSAQVYTDSVVTDTVNWFQLQGEFIADSNYQYITIGNFFDDAHTDTFNTGGALAYCAAYYIDDVCVTTDSVSCFLSNEIKKEENMLMSISPNPFTTHLQLHYTLTQPGELMVYDALGRKVKSYMLAAGRDIPWDVPTTTLPSGVYLVAINSGGRAWGEKVVKE